MNIYDIAEKAGVSVATVSRVINNNKNVSKQSKKRVMDVINQEKYVPNIFARNLNHNSSNTIGVLCPMISDINHVKPVSILERLLREQGYDILLCCTDSVSEDKGKYLHMLQTRRVDAIIMIGSTVEETEHHEHFAPVAREVPIVIINGMVELENVYSVLSDERTAIRKVVQALSRQGCRSILYMNDTASYSGYQKILGYKDGLRLCGLEEREELIIQVPEADDELVLAQQVMREFLTRSELSCDALVASDDILAVGAQKALMELGREMPIVGFNNSRFAQCATPELTSVDGNMETVCATAVQILIEVLKGRNPASTALISTRLVERGTFHSPH